MPLILGCIADDVTGGTDLALILSAAGLRVIQVLADPAPDDPVPDADAVVVALKIRTAPRQEAIDRARAAAETLKAWGAKQFFFKYCSTFDSTAHGNIGPVADALATQLGTDLVPFCPAFPANGRTVYNGHLFVGEQLLSDSPMRDHPLTPMRQSDLQVLLAPQAPDRRIGLVPLPTVETGASAIADAFTTLRRDGVDFVVVDAVLDRHLVAIGHACTGLPLITGGSALAMSLGDNYRTAGWLAEATAPGHIAPRAGPVAMLSGSCSTATQEQVRRVADKTTVIDLDPAAVADPGAVDSLAARATSAVATGGVLVSSTAPPEAVAKAQSGTAATTVGERIEHAHGTIARALYDHGVRTFIIAGGETSGAVAAALGLRRLAVGPEIAPGVPWMTDADGSGTLIAFKSGNFGGPDFFADAMATIRPAACA